ncbi:Uncharacterised protein [Shewanella morhuae]|uniref:Uncharacterized protein n=1 Tax=Shewanella morhuae TaxID=365591 RepID=A0A380BVH2_9GAMM|nr:Uncharacterised protein [Shewanella morhuae]
MALSIRHGGNNQVGELIEQNQALLSGRNAICDKICLK